MGWLMSQPRGTPGGPYRTPIFAKFGIFWPIFDEISQIWGDFDEFWSNLANMENSYFLIFFLRKNEISSKLSNMGGPKGPCFKVNFDQIWPNMDQFHQIWGPNRGPFGPLMTSPYFIIFDFILIPYLIKITQIWQIWVPLRGTQGEPLWGPYRTPHICHIFTYFI